MKNPLHRKMFDFVMYWYVRMVAEFEYQWTRFEKANVK